MKRFISVLLLGSFVASFALAAPTKSNVKNKRMQHKLEPTHLNYENVEHGSTPIVMPNIPGGARNQGVFVLVDSSTNGYGLVSQNTRPLFVDVDNSNWYATYRQYAGELTTHGQMGSAYSEDGLDWDTYTNLNYNGNPPWGGGGVGGTGVAQGRYPSALGTPDQPLSLWNEYTTGAGAAPYGGRPYYAYDEFGWGGGSFSYPADIELLYDVEQHDLWVGSPSLSYDSDADMWVVNIVYSDWTRENRWLYHSEAYEDGFVVFDGGGGELMFDEDNDLVAATDTGSYNTSGYTSCSEDGLCGCGIIGFFAGADPEAPTGNAVSEYHTGIFRLSEDHGATWHGCETGGGADVGCANDGLGYYFIPDSVWEDVIASFAPSSPVEDTCLGTSYELDDIWTGYELDFKMDTQGNPHYLIQVYACENQSEEGFCYGVPESGLYHFTADRDQLGVSADAWQWSFVMTGEYTWGFDDNSVTSYWSSNSSSLAFSVDDPEVIYVTTTMGEPGTPDPNAPLDPEDEGYCEHIETVLDYPDWSQDIYVIKSEDGGQSWWNPLNITNTPDETGGNCPGSLGLIKCDPAETYPHTYQWATDDEVFVMYQVPNWGFNEIGDLGSADFMNRVFIGTATVDDEDSIPEYGSGGGCYAEAGDLNGDGQNNIQDIVGLVGAVLGTNPLDDICAADLNGDGQLNIQDIVGLVNLVLNPGVASTNNGADNAILTAGNTFIGLEPSDGLVQGVQVTLKHGPDFEISSVDNSDYEVNEVLTSEDGTHTTILVATNGKASVGRIANIQGNYELISSEASNGLMEKVKLSNSIVNDFSISSAFPNPFNPSTSIELDLEKDAFVSVSVYNVAGQLVDQLHSGSLNKSSHTFTWNASSVSSGIYFMSIQVDNHIETKKLMLVK